MLSNQTTIISLSYYLYTLYNLTYYHFAISIIYTDIKRARKLARRSDQGNKKAVTGSLQDEDVDDDDNEEGTKKFEWLVNPPNNFDAVNPKRNVYEQLVVIDAAMSEMQNWRVSL